MIFHMCVAREIMKDVGKIVLPKCHMKQLIAFENMYYMMSNVVGIKFVSFFFL